MKPRVLLSFFVAASLAAMPLSAFAHETQNFTIGDKTYSFVVGSLNEPVAVDDKSGVELTVSLVHAEEEEHMDESQPHTHEAEESHAVTGLEKTLKVEVSAGAKKKIMDLSPKWGEPGAYQAVFFPTVQTTYTYRFFGTVNGVAVDLTFACNPAGHPQTSEDTSQVKLSDTVTRVLKKGAFGCPMAKADLGFPEPSATLHDLSSGAGTMGLIGAVLGALGVILGGIALVRSKR
jgi:hypothetical protein